MEFFGTLHIMSDIGMYGSATYMYNCDIYYLFKVICRLEVFCACEMAYARVHVHHYVCRGPLACCLFIKSHLDSVTT